MYFWPKTVDPLIGILTNFLILELVWKWYNFDANEGRHELDHILSSYKLQERRFNSTKKLPEPNPIINLPMANTPSYVPTEKDSR